VFWVFLSIDNNMSNLHRYVSLGAKVFFSAFLTRFLASLLISQNPKVEEGVMFMVALMEVLKWGMWLGFAIAVIGFWESRNEHYPVENAVESKILLLRLSCGGCW